jgi:GH15 family glucan-1,4-alpha-glucosidase
MSYRLIENCGIIGDLHTVALVAKDGSIDFMCFPEFDSPTIFAALLDEDKGGRFQITPSLSHANQKQLYLPDTNVLLTRFLSDSGIAEVSDFMPVEESGGAHRLIRRAKAIRGDIHCRLLCDPRFDYARARHHVDKKSDHEILFISEGRDKTALRLRSGVPINVENGKAVAEFTLRAGKTAAFILESVNLCEEHPSNTDDYVSEAFKDTVNFWRRWVAHSTYSGRWREVMTRSALTLKLMTSERHGTIVAAPTFGLPEMVGGERNWDYRYTWLRDSAFTIYGLLRMGYTGEAGAFIKWLSERCLECGHEGTFQPIYGIDGRQELPEENLPHLEGYRRSSPVRIGNAASTQLQLDIYGELMDSVYLYNKYGEPISYDLWKTLVRSVDWVCDNWHKPDEGIWEVRGGRKEFLYSQLMCWVAIDRGIRLAEKRSFPAPLNRWLEVRDRIYRHIFEQMWDSRLEAFVQYKGSNTLDAASLLMPLVKFVGPTDPRWLSTLKSIDQELVDDSLVYRYKVMDKTSDGLRGKEGTFNMCSFWYIECLARSGDLPKARFFFEKMLGYANHLGLYAEEIGHNGEQLGNFPQAFTHLGLISAGYYLNRALSERT